MLNHGSLFSGIGGFDLAAEWMGWKNVFQVEINVFCQKVLKKNFPDTKQYSDITKFNGTQYEHKIDILTGGFPCQPFSVAGKRKGRNDNRFLWPEMLRIVREIKPTYVIAENVHGIINMELRTVCSDLENEGYQVQPFSIPACAVNAPHQRQRVWIIAHSNCFRQQRRFKRMYQPHDQRFITKYLSPITLQQRWQGNNLPPPGICRSTDGLPNRLDRIKSLGNAIVPPLAYSIFCILEEFDKTYFHNQLTSEYVF
jgi:DNA (cytosine-5)-methyltransferase 1